MSAEILGFIHFWGLSPAINLSKHYQIPTKSQLNILVSGGSDIRHVLKTVSDNCDKEEFLELKFWIHEKQKEVLARIALQVLVLGLDISEREKMELFLELHSNSMLREKTSQFLDQAVRILIS